MTAKFKVTAMEVWRLQMRIACLENENKRIKAANVALTRRIEEMEMPVAEAADWITIGTAESSDASSRQEQSTCE